ncbi:MAG: hypothetical protein OQL05_10140 [Gammaproteobacteria bacterium]|nr:hypothetical protein [Gammaproteobacteria bacterium]MCW8957933.1 hypothetical protein [Gammaproteobacteria bacterium]MCW8973620.1 hypothetical protein [Gammaproteobacteria bacterium]MCW8993752.1 hypothetical protein [Gammaproteobacteria bacterium]
MMNPLLRTRRLVGLLMLALAFPLAASAQEQPDGSEAPRVVYDAEDDRFTLKARDASLKAVLQELSVSSGLEVLFDDEAERRISVSLEQVPLELGVKELLRGSSNIARYSKNEAGEHMLIGVVVLPEGKSDRSAARQLLAPQEEFTRHARSSRDGQAMPRRWQARVNEMPPERRKRMDKMAKMRLMTPEQRKEDFKKQREEMFAERREMKQQRMQDKLARMTPEQQQQYLRRQEAAEVARQRMQQRREERKRDGNATAQW